MKFKTVEERIGILYNHFIDIKRFIIETNQNYRDDLEDDLCRRLNRVIANIEMYLEEDNKKKEPARAYLNYNALTFNLGMFNFDITLIFHELGHLITYYLSLANSHEPITKHQLEFAIITYVLFYQYSRIEPPFNYYDIHEEKDIKHININIYNFNRFIKKLKFNNLNHLYEQARDYAEKARTKIANKK